MVEIRVVVLSVEVLQTQNFLIVVIVVVIRTLNFQSSAARGIGTSGSGARGSGTNAKLSKSSGAWKWYQRKIC